MTNAGNNKPTSGSRKSSRAKTTTKRYTPPGNEPLTRVHLQTSLDHFRAAEATEAAEALQLQKYHDAAPWHHSASSGAYVWQPLWSFAAPAPVAAPVFVFGAAPPPVFVFGAAPQGVASHVAPPAPAPAFVFGAASATPVSFVPHPFQAPPLAIPQDMAQELHQLLEVGVDHTADAALAPVYSFQDLQLAAKEATVNHMCSIVKNMFTFHFWPQRV